MSSVGSFFYANDAGSHEPEGFFILADLDHRKFGLTLAGLARGYCTLLALNAPLRFSLFLPSLLSDMPRFTQRRGSYRLMTVSCMSASTSCLSCLNIIMFLAIAVRHQVEK